MKGVLKKITLVFVVLLCGLFVFAQETNKSVSYRFYLVGEDSNLSVKIDVTDWVLPESEINNQQVVMKKVLSPLPITLTNKGNAKVDFSHTQEKLCIYSQMNELLGCEFDLNEKCENYPDSIGKNLSKKILVLSNYTSADMLVLLGGMGSKIPGSEEDFSNQLVIQSTPDVINTLLLDAMKKKSGTGTLSKDEITNYYSKLNVSFSKGESKIFWGNYIYSVYEKEIPLYLNIEIQ